MKKHFFVLTLILITVSRNIFSQIPQTISYQGILTDGNGNPVSNDTYLISFYLYDVAIGGTELWAEEHEVLVINGIFNVILGSNIPIDLPFNKPYWLGILMHKSGEQLTPRIQLTAAAYSLNARTVADNSVTTSKIADKAVTLSKINTTGAARNEIIAFNGSEAVWTSPPSGGDLSLPFSGTSFEDGDAFSVQHEGENGKAGYFAITGNNDSTAIKAETYGKGSAAIFHIESNPLFNLTGEHNNSDAIEAVTNGTGRAGSFKILNSGNSREALEASTNGSGSAISAYSYGSGNVIFSSNYGEGGAGFFGINNPNSNSTALQVKTNADGHGVYSQTEGNGSAIYGQTKGLGRAGSFEIDNSSNNKEALNAFTNGSGDALYASTYGTGRAGFFGINNTNNTKAALEASTNGSGPAVRSNGDLYVHDGAFKGNIGSIGGAPFPRPAWDSGWLSYEPNEMKTLQHNLGGNTDDYFVYMVFKGISLYGVNQFTYGGIFTQFNVAPAGAYWSNLTTNEIKVTRGTKGYYAAEQIRIRIWVIR